MRLWGVFQRLVFAGSCGGEFLSPVCGNVESLSTYFREFGLTLLHAINVFVQMLYQGVFGTPLRMIPVRAGELRRAEPSALDLEFEDYRRLQWTLSHCWELR